MSNNANASPRKSLAALSNPGIHVINAPEPHRQMQAGQCTVVLGTARGGTSAVAGALSSLGVDMGPGALPPVFEDLELALAIEAGDHAQASTVIDQRQQPGKPWGFKRPGYIQYADSYHELLGEVRYIAIFRDPMAIAARASLSSNTEIVTSIRTALAEFEAIREFLSEANAHALLISYEKLLQQPQDFVDSLIAFAQIQPLASQVSAARQLISASPPDYVDQTRNTKSRGRIDIVETRRIRGWAQYLSYRRQATVSVMINDQEVDRVAANQHREDLTSMGVSEDGCCAFDLCLETPLKKGDVVRVRATEDISDIMNSPCTYHGEDILSPGTGIAGIAARAWRRRPWNKAQS